MDVFALRDRVVGEYRDYFESFVNILDPKIEEFVRGQLARGEIWPDAVLQLNPAFEQGATLGELAARGAITRETARFFGPDLRLHRHQEEVLDAARTGKPYVVTTGTGSGKSLTYLIPIVDHVFRNDPGRPTVRAIIVYPMNALVNSQREALERFRARNWPDCPVRFGRYTGQDREEDRKAILGNPPHILLTNYVMLEYMLLRPSERVLVGIATKEPQFLVLDELHVYRGRQGADVAMLLRRVRQRIGNPDLQFIGTSATLASEGGRDERHRRIAAVGESLFGVPVPQGHVVGETLRRVARVPVPDTAEALRDAVLRPPLDPSALLTHPLAAWIEETFGLTTEADGRLVRRRPISFAEGVQALARATGLDEGLCRERLHAALDAGSSDAARTPSGDPALAFRLHQFLGSGGSVYATLEPPGERLLTTEGQFVAAGEADGGGRRLLYPLAFCRECGQEYALVTLGRDDDRLVDLRTGRAPGEAARRLLPRSPLLNAVADDSLGTHGFFAVQRDDLWSGGDEALPDHWLEERKAGWRVKKDYAAHVPKPYWVRPDGELSEEPVDGAIQGWFQPRPLMLCLRCKAAYDRREKSDFGKLATLSQIGRSTATTITVGGAVAGLAEGDAEPASQKVLSFTDNRQDASLQAGHLNDFVQVTLLRGALVQALRACDGLTFERLGPAIFAALDLQPEAYQKDAVASGPGFASARRAMEDLLQYRAIEDLRRAWRVAQPNLEQCGLLRIDYAGLRELARDDARWHGLPGLGELVHLG